MNRKFPFILLLAASLLSNPGWSAPKAPKSGSASESKPVIAKPAIAKPAGIEVNLVPAQGKTSFRAIGRPSALKIVGEGTGPEGSISVSGEVARGTFAVDLNSLDTGIKLRNEHMKEKYLETGKYPKATLTVDAMKVPHDGGKGDFRFEKLPFAGMLNLHGVDRPVTGSADVERSGGKVKVKAEFSLKIPEYGMGIPKYMGITVAEDVQVTVESDAAL
jgi:polyisoprenoid-binding protein YceI